MAAAEATKEKKREKNKKNARKHHEEYGHYNSTGFYLSNEDLAEVP